MPGGISMVCADNPMDLEPRRYAFQIMEIPVIRIVRSYDTKSGNLNVGHLLWGNDEARAAEAGGSERLVVLAL